MRIVTAKEVANFLKLTDSTIYNLAMEGKLPAFRIGNSWRFDMDQIMQQIRETQGADDKETGGSRQRAPRAVKKTRIAKAAPAK